MTRLIMIATGKEVTVGHPVAYAPWLDSANTILAIDYPRQRVMFRDEASMVIVDPHAYGLMFLRDHSK